MTLLLAFLGYTVAKLVTGVVLMRRTRWWWTPGASALALGLGLSVGCLATGAVDPNLAGALVGLGGVGLAASRWLHVRALRVYG